MQETDAFKEGKILIQNISSQEVAKYLDAHDGMHVLDLCAAPGTKTEQIAEMTAAGDMSYLKPAVLAMSGMPVLELNDREYADVIVGKKIRAKEGAEPDIKYAAFHNGELTAVLYLAEENGKRLMRIERMLKGNA